MGAKTTTRPLLTPRGDLYIPGITQPTYAQKLAEQVPTLITLAGALIVLLATLFPFDAHWPAGHSFSQIFQRFEWDITRHSTASKIYDITTNIVLFMPLGFGVAARVLRSGFRRRNLAVAAAAITGMLLSMSVEMVQLFLPERDPSLIDILSNTTGALVGGLVVRSWGQWMLIALPQRIGDEIGRPSARIFGGLLAIWIAWPIFLALAYAGSLTLDSWDPTTPLIIANEADSARPWHGRVSELHLTNRALDADQINHLFNGEPVADIANDYLIASYTFHGDHESYEDATQRQPPLAWVQESNVLPDGTPVFKHARYLATDEPARDIVRAIRDADAFTLIATVATDDLEQSNDRRIITLSTSGYSRNLTLSQEGAHLNVRIRNGVTGENGRRPQLLINNVFVDKEYHRIVLTYNHGRVQAYVDAHEPVGEVIFTPPLAVLWQSFPRSTWAIRLADAPTGLHTWLFYGLAFAPLGVLAAVQSTLVQHRWRLWLFVAAITLPPLALQLVFWLTYLTPIAPRDVVLTVLIPAATGLIALLRLKAWRRNLAGV